MEKSAGRSTPRAAYSSMISWGNLGAVCSPMGPAPIVCDGHCFIAVCIVLIRRLSGRLGTVGQVTRAGHAVVLSKRTTTDLLAGVLLVSAVEPRGTSTLVSG